MGALPNNGDSGGHHNEVLPHAARAGIRVMGTRLREAILNNASWCEYIASSHGVAGSRNAHAWFAREPMPPLYPNLVTLDPNVTFDEEIEALDQALPPGWGIKDSFMSLDLADRGFELALQGQWYAREPDHDGDLSPCEDRGVRAVRTVKDLDRWCLAWTDTADGVSIFLPGLLSTSAVKLLYVEQAGSVVSGLVTNVGAGVLGISNAFGEPGGVISCLRHAIEAAQSRPIVGYGGTLEVEFVNSMGFYSMGGMQVWVRL